MGTTFRFVNLPGVRQTARFEDAVSRLLSFVTPSTKWSVPPNTLRFDNLLEDLREFTESCYSYSLFQGKNTD
jgi:hypothetical protein